MKTYLATKNTPFALDVLLEGAVLTYKIYESKERQQIGDLNGEDINGRKYVDLITEWRGDYAVFSELLHERSINLEVLRQHAEFGDRASFMLYAPNGFASDGMRNMLFQQTPNLYVATIATKMDAQAYHATVVQAHPVGHILIPLKTSPTSDWSIGFNVADPVLAKMDGDLQPEPCVTLAMVREETLPVVKFTGNTETANGIKIDFQIQNPDGTPITGHNAEVFIEATSGYIRDRRVMTVNGAGSTLFRPDGLVSGSSLKIKVGFKHFSGTDDLVMTVA